MRKTLHLTATCGKTETYPGPGRLRQYLAASLPSYQQRVKNSVENEKNFFHLHLISDSTGETLISAGRAVSAQFQASMAIEHVYPLVRNRKQLLAVLEAIDRKPGIVLYTIVDPELAEDRKRPRLKYSH